MKSSQFAEILTVAADTMASCAQRGAVDDLRQLAGVFGAAGQRSVVAALEQLSDSQAARQHDLRAPMELLDLVAGLQRLMIKAAAPKAAADCAALLEFTRRFADPSTRELKLGSAVEAFVVSGKGRKPTVDRRKFDSSTARAYADRLTVALNDKQAFDRTVSEMCKLQQASLGDLTDVAQRFLGDNRTFKSKTEALKAIELRRRQVEVQENRHKALAKIAV